VRFRVLGPVEALADEGQAVALPPKPRALLAVLLLEAGRRVGRQRLMSALWPELPPPSAQHVVRTYVSALRQLLRLPRRDMLPRLIALGDGYRLELRPDDLDLLVFNDWTGRGRQALTDGDAATAARLLDRALDLWRGDPAEDVTVDDETEIVCAGLAERRLLAEEDRAQARLALGDDAAMIPRLRLLVAANPLRERPWAQLMTALYRTGEQAAALAAYQQVRAHLIDELGVEPGPGLRKLHQQVLAGEPLPAPLQAEVFLGAPVPRQLPPDVSHFTGRTAELDRLDKMLGTPAADPVITAINGTPGAGKSALAIHWAHQVAARFPGGHLYAGLRAHGPLPPADPLEVLARFLRALGVAADRVPADLDEASALYRSLLDGKRILVVLDDAASSAQVRPLLPGTPGCAVIVTSRGTLPGLGAREGTIQLPLPPLRPVEAVALLRRILGPQRAEAEPETLAAIAAGCAFLPLPLRIAAERAVTRPHLKLASLAARLATASERLDLLVAEDDPATSMRTVLSWSYQALSPDAARMFRLVGLHPGPDISVQAAAALADGTQAETARLLETLADAHLIDEAAALRYRFHALLRGYAAERAGMDESAANRADALRRVLTWYLHAADAANRCLGASRRRVPLAPAPHIQQPVFSDYDQALAWSDAELANLAAAVHAAAEAGQDDIAWKLPAAMADFFRLRRPWSTWLSCCGTGLTAARRAGDTLGQAWSVTELGAASHGLRRFADAARYYEQALPLVRQASDRQDEGAALNNLAIAYWELSRTDDALECLRQSLALARDTGNRHGECVALDNLGEVYRQCGQAAQAITCHEQALDIAVEIGDRQGTGQALYNLGEVYRALHQSVRARACYARAVDAYRQADDRQGMAETHLRLGELAQDGGSITQARGHWRQALAIFSELGDPQADELRTRLEASA
jgi:DNA-binding SARP family transcriptional activator/tetratricopeptide (TPR) repeat protein